jgi:hypothetical protein
VLLVDVLLIVLAAWILLDVLVVVVALLLARSERGPELTRSPRQPSA